jgi:hypothetical protein
MENGSHNADQAARKAEMMKRAQMAIDGRQGAVGCGHSGDAVKRATRAVYAQKKRILSGVGHHTHTMRSFEAARRALGKVFASVGIQTLRSVFSAM